jgi:glycosyltransferase involved in cell wall biosynthesis
MAFDHDDQFLVSTFESIIQALPPDLIEQGKSNGSYYDFHIKTEEYIIVPKHMNFTFKYVHLIKQHDPEYWERLLKGWDKLISPLFGDPLDPIPVNKINATFDQVYTNNMYGIMPPVEREDDDFIYFKNLESVATPLTVSVTAAAKFAKLYENPVEHQWNEHVKVYVFPVNNTRFYGMVNGELKMLYPKWNAHRWSTELPKFIIDTRDLNKIMKFKQFDINQEQETIRIMNGAAAREVFK